MMQGGVLSQQQFDSLVEELRAAANAWAAVSHLHWGLWGLVQHSSASAINFDYGSYAVERLACLGP